jgi:hypothetical protein
VANWVDRLRFTNLTTGRLPSIPCLPCKTNLRTTVCAYCVKSSATFSDVDICTEFGVNLGSIGGTGRLRPIPGQQRQIRGSTVDLGQFKRIGDS